jgi:hypothetical protein
VRGRTSATAALANWVEPLSCLTILDVRRHESVAQAGKNRIEQQLGNVLTAMGCCFSRFREQR